MEIYAFAFPYTVNHTAHVGKYPKIIGPNPLYNPLIPSSVRITFPVPNIPLYTAAFCGTFSLACAARNPPCACSFVLITSSGHVTMPDMKPPVAPANAWNAESDRSVMKRSHAVAGTWSSSAAVVSLRDGVEARGKCSGRGETKDSWDPIGVGVLGRS